MASNEEEQWPPEGSVVQRIFREAKEAQGPWNTPERNDDIRRMKWLAKQLRGIKNLIDGPESEEQA